MSLGNDARDIGQLLSYALRPKMQPGLEGEYGRLLRRYQDDMSIRDAFNYVLDGMQLRVLHAGDLGVVLTAHRESVFAYRLAGEQGSGNKARNALRGLAHIGIAAYAHPHPDDLTDTTVRYVDVMAVEELIRRACSQLKTRADEVAQGGETADRVVDLALAAGLDTVWSAWDQMPAINIGTRGRRSGRISTKSTTYWVLRACKDLVAFRREAGERLVCAWCRDVLDSVTGKAAQRGLHRYQIRAGWSAEVGDELLRRRVDDPGDSGDGAHGVAHCAWLPAGHHGRVRELVHTQLPAGRADGCNLGVGGRSASDTALLTPVATTRPSRTTSAPNGSPPFSTLSKASWTARSSSSDSVWFMSSNFPLVGFRRLSSQLIELNVSAAIAD